MKINGTMSVAEQRLSAQEVAFRHPTASAQRQERALLIARAARKAEQLVKKHQAEIYGADDPLLKFFELRRGAFVNSLEIQGLDKIPSRGKLIIATNHQFGATEAFNLVLEVMGTQPARPWAFVGNTFLISILFPDWERDERFIRHIIPVRRQGHGPSAKIINGREIISKAVRFLQDHNDPILFFAPEGGRAELQMRILPPSKGVAIIARQASALIVPVRFIGKIDPSSLRCSLRGDILDPFGPDGEDKKTLNRWFSQYPMYAIETAATFFEGISRVVQALEEKITGRSALLVTVYGGPGAGKSTFAEQLKKQLEDSGKSCLVINGDNFHLYPSRQSARWFDSRGLQATVEAARTKYDVIILEGVITNNQTLKQLRLESDYKLFIEADPHQRNCRRMIRNNNSGRYSLAESLQLLVEVVTQQPDFVREVMSMEPGLGTDLVVLNEYEESGDPQLTIHNNRLVFFRSGREQASLALDFEGRSAAALTATGIIKTIKVSNML